MTKLFFRALAGRLGQGMTDWKGMLLRPRTTLLEIAEREDWAIPGMLLFITLSVGLPFLFVLRGTVTDRFTLMTSGFLGVAFFIALLAVSMKLMHGKACLKTLLRLSGFVGVPYLTFGLLAVVIGVLLFAFGVFPIKGGPLVASMFVLPFVCITAWSVWIAYLTARAVYRTATSTKCLVGLLAAIVLANAANNTLAVFLSKADLIKEKWSIPVTVVERHGEPVLLEPPSAQEREAVE